MSSNKTSVISLALFCKVVDNYGDIGICWRLARQLRQEHGIAVVLWVDDLRSFRRICPQVVVDAEAQEVFGVTVRYWRDQEGVFSVDEVADIVIEFFGCDIPPGYISAMAERHPRPVWLNLEGLSAEEWVEGCHTLPSSHPRLPLTKHFFFPGFTSKTGGLLHESGLEQQRQQFQADRAAKGEFLARLGLTAAEMDALKVSLFCYPHAPVSALFEAWQGGSAPVTCLVPEGVAADAVKSFFAGEAASGAAMTRGALTVRIMPFVAQPDYDRLLWACDLNFVRGEDSFVRAQWAGKPFIWHIYPQDKNLHHVKLRAFLQRYSPDMSSVNALSLRWNGATSGDVEGQPGWPDLWKQFQADIPMITRRTEEWRRQVLANGDLAANLLKFAASLRSVAPKNEV
ncbi:elongation factor P maturation arginine rhamnosyltransferase EarP [Noviherbaspirillum sp. UKPF54]|uniref:elongation factor P maturation arginine rhamnosyltransferase EarP n=1 Tax=Noviherbaspirillum sp. UKPF54 TaxID=2601898 RepID=UPI0011B0FCA6|nr:elongation factor P maturation arginine rhamnosyltransferase EarP [Noviherbaspirillum sp. UKPF54]QDZ28412.1 elongation factor P maturation arginine rhamnosyltransferase EarP [Noviherbaspirillum sp. UKPF54]